MLTRSVAEHGKSIWCEEIPYVIGGKHITLCPQRPARSLAMRYALTVSVTNVVFGPCCSHEPTGISATFISGSTSATSGQIMSSRIKRSIFLVPPFSANGVYPIFSAFVPTPSQGPYCKGHTPMPHPLSGVRPQQATVCHHRSSLVPPYRQPHRQG